ncbi:hypothetical protein D9758_018797 [Tetrapyrgos nigripes]|uniref:Uncharacterized protein n=1 Tax=Tetrapyrgos nigripes TaxID=182062 RepID=A0A8H5BUP1_9AGAR|nr:hypothetical protein D9758_018797 [Tetrapyrgos nigripes]
MAYITDLPTELIEKIFKSMVNVSIDDAWFRIDVPTKASRSDLLSCALTYSAFFSPAMRILWSTSEVIRLLKLLPGFEIVDGCYRITGNFNEDSLKRFDLYSPMVKTLSHHGTWVKDTHPVHESVFTSLALSRPSPLLPSLTHVSCCARTKFAAATGETMFMTSPVLKSVLFAFCDGRDIMRYLSTVIKDKDAASALESLTIVHPRPYSRSRFGFDFDCISQLPNLTVLHFDLSLSLSTVDRETGLGAVFQLPTRLKQLHLQRALYTPPKDLFAVLGLYRESKTESFSLERSALTGGDLKAVFRVISSQWSQTMTSLWLDIKVRPQLSTSTSRSGNDENGNFLDIIRPLYSLHNLRFFTGSFSSSSSFHTSANTPAMKCVQNVYVTDTFTLISDICECKAWRKLIEFEIRGTGTCGFEDALAVTSLAEHCPRLKRISVPFDIDILATPSFCFNPNQSFSLKSSPNHQLKSMTLVVKDGIGIDIPDADADSGSIGFANSRPTRWKSLGTGVSLG